MEVRKKSSNRRRLIDYYYLAEKIECPGVPLVYWDDIETAPTIDAVPVTRCEDCKYCNISLVLPTGREMYTCMEGSHDHQMLLNPNDFCSRGERKGVE